MSNEGTVGEIGSFTNHDPANTPADSYAKYERWRESCPVAHSDALGGFYMFTRFADVRAAAKDWRTYSSADGFTLPPLPFRANIIQADPPLHATERELIKEVLNVGMYRRFEEHARADAIRLIEAFLPDGHVDLLERLCEPLPVLTICGMVGLDAEESIRVRPVAMETFAATRDTALAMEANQKFNALVREFSDARRAAPRDDFMTRLATRPWEGGLMSDDEIGNFVQGVLIAGHHTTTSAMASMFRHILGDEELKQRLIADRELLRPAVEETLRLYTPLHMFGRTTRCPVQVAGADIPDRSFVMLNWASANRDAEQFERPDEFRLDRSPNPHVAFGHGIHTCTGAQLARIELEAVANEVLTRVPDMALDGDPPDYEFAGGNLATMPELRVRFAPRDREVAGA